MGFLVSDLTKLGPHDSTDRILGDLYLLGVRSDRTDAVLIGIGNPQARLPLGTEFRERLLSIELPSSST